MNTDNDKNTNAAQAGANAMQTGSGTMQAERRDAQTGQSSVQAERRDAQTGQSSVQAERRDERTEQSPVQAGRHAERAVQSDAAHPLGDGGTAPPADGERKKPRRGSLSQGELVFALVTALLFTVINSFGLSYIYTYYAGDIEHQVLPVVTYYLIQVLSALLPYLPLAVSLRSVCVRGARKSIPLFIISAVGLMMPYVSPPLLELLLGTGSNMKSYLGYIGLWLFDLLVYAVSILTVPLLGVRDKRAESTDARGRGKRKRSARGAAKGDALRGGAAKGSTAQSGTVKAGTAQSDTPQGGKRQQQSRPAAAQRKAMQSQQGSRITSAALSAMRQRAGIEQYDVQSDAQGNEVGANGGRDARNTATANSRNAAQGRTAQSKSSAGSGRNSAQSNKNEAGSRGLRRFREKLGKGIPATLRRSMNASALIRLAIGVITEIYYAVLFFYSLANEYYRAPYASELLIMAGLFLLQGAYALVGRLIMNRTVRMIDAHEKRKEE